MEHSNKHKRGEKEEMKEEANESGAGNVNMMESSSSVNPGSGVKRKVAELDDSEPYTSDAGSKVANAIRADISKSTTAERFDNRFTRMKLKREVLIRTNKGFVEWFNLNSHLTLKECWEEQPNRNEKGDLGEKD